MRHVHGIGFRIIGEAFAMLPKADEVVLSGYSRRPDKSTGEVQDQYLYSVRVSRNEWARINFANLDDVDPAEALGLANAFMAPIHGRMSAILTPEAWSTWLDPRTDAKTLPALFRAWPEGLLKAYPVSPAANSPKNDSSALLEPVTVT